MILLVNSPFGRCLLLLFVCSPFHYCITQEKCLQKYPPSQKVEVLTLVRDRIRDSLVQLPPDSSWLEALLACDSVGKVYLKELIAYKSGEHLKVPSLGIKNNLLRVNAESNVSIQLQWKERDTLKEHIELNVSPPLIVHELTLLQKLQIWLGRMFLLLILGFVLKKRIPKF